MKFFHKKACEKKPQEPDGIMITDKMKIYIIRNSQDNSVLGSILLSDFQFHMLEKALTDVNITITRN